MDCVWLDRKKAMCLLIRDPHDAAVLGAFSLHFHSQIREYFSPVAFHAGLAMFLGDQASTDSREGFGTFKQPAPVALYLDTVLSFQDLDNAAEQVFVVGGNGHGHVLWRYQVEFLEGCCNLASTLVHELAETFFAQLASYVTAATIKAPHPHCHNALLNLFQRYVGNICHAEEPRIWKDFNSSLLSGNIFNSMFLEKIIQK